MKSVQLKAIHTGGTLLGVVASKEGWFTPASGCAPFNERGRATLPDCDYSMLDH